MVESRKARKSDSESGKRWKRNVLKEEMDRLEAMEDEKLLAYLMVKLRKRSKRKSQEQEEEHPTKDYFDEYLSCFNFICKEEGESVKKHGNSSKLDNNT